MSARPVADRMEVPLLALLEATESLLASLSSDGPEELEALFARRAEAVAHLERIASEEALAGAARRSAASRACLERIGRLDREILESAGEALARLQQERSALVQRRHAVQAHGLRAPELARAVAVKA